MRILVTGHTGFKGAWLSSFLTLRGHEVHGLSNSAPRGGLFELAEIGKRLSSDSAVDIRDLPNLEKVFERVKPDMVIHLAAQPLVRESYQKPLETFDTNSQGTLNVLSSLQKHSPESFLLSITTDKVYLNTSKLGGYKEDDALGAGDPYSTSKAMADLALQSWSMSFPSKPRIAIARAGNVIGPLDTSEERLIPDIERAIARNQNLEIRYPSATRPWQYILDCLSGYVKLIDQRESVWEGAWNFGPLPTKEKTVAEVVETARGFSDLRVELNEELRIGMPEHGLLSLDSTKARETLNWTDKINFEDTIQYALEFGKRLRSLNANDAWKEALAHIEMYESL